LLQQKAQGKRAAAYTLFVEVLTLKIIQRRRFSCHLKSNMRLSISDQ